MKLVTWIVLMNVMQGVALGAAALVNPGSWWQFLGWTGVFLVMQLPLPIYIGLQMWRAE